MENASKALLIAASVLIAVVLIAFGMRIFNTTTGTSDELEGTMNTTEVAMFNNKFIPYIKTNNSKAQILTLLNTIIVNNSTTDNKIAIKYGTVQGVDYTEDLGEIRTIMQQIADSNLTKFQVKNIGGPVDIANHGGRIFMLQIIGH